MKQNNPAPLTNYKVQQMIQRVIDAIPLDEQAKITNTPRLNQLFLDQQKAIQNHQYLKAQIIGRQFSSEHEAVIAKHALKKMSEGVISGNIINYMEPDDKMRYLVNHLKFTLLYEALDSTLVDIQGIIDSYGITAQANMMPELQKARVAIDKWMSAKTVSDKEKNIIYDEADRIYKHICKRAEVTNNKIIKLKTKKNKRICTQKKSTKS